jgi:hypothetical protein
MLLAKSPATLLLAAVAVSSSVPLLLFLLLVLVYVTQPGHGSQAASKLSAGLLLLLLLLPLLLLPVSIVLSPGSVPGCCVRLACCCCFSRAACAWSMWALPHASMAAPWRAGRPADAAAACWACCRADSRWSAAATVSACKKKGAYLIEQSTCHNAFLVIHGTAAT